MKTIEMIKNLAQRNSVVASADVLAVFAELEAKDERIGELEVIATEYAGKFQKAQDANKHLIIMSNDDKRRIAELEAEAKVWESAATKHLERAEGAEKRLATPVRLPVVLMGYQSDDYRIGFMEGVEKSGDEVRAAGFTVEGDE